MRSKVNQKFSGLADSATLAIKALATSLRSQGRDVLDLSAGEPDSPTPEHVRNAGIQAINSGFTRYTPVPGIPDLRKAIAEKYSKLQGIEHAAENVIVTNGGKQALFELFSVVLEEGDEVLMTAPSWLSYEPMVQLAGAKCKSIKVAPESGYEATAEQFDQAINPNTRLVIINSPSNPTGAAYSKAQLQEIGAKLKARIETDCPNLMIVSDEVYREVAYSWFESCSFLAVCPELAPYTFTVDAFSKSHAMTGWRVGYCIGDKSVIKAMSKFQSQSTSNVCSIAQKAALAAATGGLDFLPEMCARFEGRLQKVIQIVNEIDGVSLPVRPKGAFYVFLRCDELIANGVCKGSVDLAAKFLEEAGVAVVPGEPFGDDGGFRISVAVQEDAIINGLMRIKDLLAK